MGRSLRYLLLGWLTLLALASARPATACFIDGVPSMALDGHLVVANLQQATRDNLSYWSPSC
jgi:hypothetical protein